MCAIVLKYVRHEYNASDRQGGQQSQRQGQLRLSRLHARLASIRNDTAHQLATNLTRRFDTIVTEDLNVSGLAKNPSLRCTGLRIWRNPAAVSRQAGDARRARRCRSPVPPVNASLFVRRLPYWCERTRGIAPRMLDLRRMRRRTSASCERRNQPTNIRHGWCQSNARGHGASTGMRKHTGTCRG